jgi:hypothetical protein
MWIVRMVRGTTFNGSGLLAGMVRAPNQRSRLDVLESHGLPNAFELPKLIGVVKTVNRKVIHAGPEVLTQGEDVAPDSNQVPHSCQKFLLLLAEAEHQPRLAEY